MATVTVSAVTGGVSVTGTGYTGSRALVTVQFTSTDNRRRYLESHHVPVVGGAISATIPTVFAGGSVVVKAFDPTTNSLSGTSNTQAV